MFNGIIGGTLLLLVFSGCASVSAANISDAELIAARGHRLLLIMDYDNALEDFNRAIRLNPDCQFAYKYRGLTNVMLKRNFRALLDFNRAIRLSPDDTEVYGFRGSLYFDEGKYKKAYDDFDKAVRINPEWMDSDFYYNRAKIYHAKKRYNEALENYNLVPESVRDADFYYNRFVVYYKLKRYAEAMPDVDMVITLDPDNGDYYHSRSYLHECLGQYQEALDDIHTALRLKPERAWLYRRITRRIEKSIKKSN
ncbi:MAG: tetratricopeptide repeat protein [Treponema sp.]|jgi:tetratricopeptide (TPR) repeat protein|nr:tetratricopeptide repeat protein [Treponema sp.]